MILSYPMRKTIALCIVAAWTLLAGMAFGDTLEDAWKVSAREDRTADQTVQQALSTPAVEPAYLSYKVIKPRPAFKLSHHPVIGFLRATQLATSKSAALSLHDPLLAYRFKLFQFLSVYRL